MNEANLQKVPLLQICQHCNSPEFVFSEAKTPLSPFVVALVHASPWTQTGHDCLAVHHYRIVMFTPSYELPLPYKHCLIGTSTQATLPLCGISITVFAKHGTGSLLRPPQKFPRYSLMSKTGSRRSVHPHAHRGTYRFSNRPQSPISKFGNRFPSTKLEARGIPHVWIFAVRHRLPVFLLASPPVPIWLGLSWLSFSRSGR